MKPYTKDFYSKRQEGAKQSAREIVPLVLELVKPKSIVDVGCGTGDWLSVCKECGMEDILGIDGDSVDKTLLQIPEEKFLFADLKKPIHINRLFDLAMSLEVAEHLPIECAEDFVNSLVRLSSVVFFSAAVPFQGGRNHINEQWPDYWKQHFQRCGYVVVDALRKKIWQNDKIKYWYCQNILFFVEKEYLMGNVLLKKEWENTSEEQLSIIHPKLYSFRCTKTPSFKKALSMLFSIMKNNLLQTVKKIFQRNNTNL